MRDRNAENRGRQAMLGILCLLPILAGCGGGGSSGDGGVPEELHSPAVARQPASQTLPAAHTAVFTVAAVDDTGLSYQWQGSGDGSAWEDIAGAVDSRCEITGQEAVDGGWRWFRCTLSNRGGNILSDAAELTVVTVVFVRPAPALPSDGATWGSAYASLAEALAAAVSGTEIWVAAGTYTPGASDTDSFVLKWDVAVYGGFAGSESCREARDWKANETVLSGEIGGSGTVADNCHTVVTGVSGARLDGFTVTRGFSYETSYQRSGGMVNFEASPTVANCVFAENWGLRGCGMYNDTCSPTVINCVFRDSATSYWGGGMYNYAASAKVIGCTFTNNSAMYGGAGMFNECAAPLVIGCFFLGNTGGEGAGLRNTRESSPAVINCVFAGNTAPSGAAVFFDSGTLELVNCTLAGNAATYAGGGILGTGTGRLVLKNSIVWGNTAAKEAQISYTGSDVDIARNCVEGGFSGGEIVSDDPRFAPAPEPGNVYGDLRLQDGSPCIDAGITALIAAGYQPAVAPRADAGDLSSDIGGNPRVSGDAVDLGAYEYRRE
jgi:hypothetical protein